MSLNSNIKKSTAKTKSAPFLDKAVLERSYKIFKDFIEESFNNNQPIITFKKKEELLTLLDLSLPKDGSWDLFFTSLENYIKYSIKTGHSQNFNQLWSGITAPGLLADNFTTLTNTSMATYEMAPIATLIEKTIIQEIKQLIGFKKGEGLFVSGGSQSNLVSICCARHKKEPTIKEKGLYGISHPLTLFVSEQAHYSFSKAATLLGIGSNSIKKVKSSIDGTIIPEELEKAIKISLEKGEQPFYIGATTGSPLTGSFDPINEIAAIAKSYGLWLHIDGAYGGAVLFSDKHKKLLDGIEKADSFSWDFHKVMGLPLSCSAVIIKDPSSLYDTFQSPGMDYMFHNEEEKQENQEDQFDDLGLLSIQCGRRVDALKLWLSWKYYGYNGYKTRIERFFKLAEHAESIVTAHPNLELIVPRKFLTLCFRYIPKHQNLKDLTDSEISDFNLQLRKTLWEKGLSLINYGFLKGQVTFRIVIANESLEVSDLDQLFFNISETADELLNTNYKINSCNNKK